MSALEIGLAIAIFGPIIGVYMFLYNHTTNNKHVDKMDIAILKKNVVYRDTCEAEKKSIAQQIKSHAELANQRHDSLVELIKTKFAALEKAVRNNGRS